MMGDSSKLYEVARRVEDVARKAMIKALGGVEFSGSLPQQNQRPAQAPLRFMFTIDTEISLGGALDDHNLSPVGAERRIWCQTEAGRYGIERFMDVFDEFEMKGVFFFEPFGVNIVDPGPMKEAAQHIANRGHDVELHVHPEFNINLEEQRALGTTPKNLMRNYSLQEQRRMLIEGADMIEQWTGRRPKAFRAGSYGLDAVGLQACAEAGLSFDSSYSAWALEVGICGLSRDPLLNDLTLLENQLIEIPVTNLWHHRPRGGVRNLDLASLNTTEMVAALEGLHEAGAWMACSITHSFRLLKIFDQQMQRTRPDHVNLHRLRSLCRYLHQHRDRFEVCTFEDLPIEALKKQLRPPPARPYIPSLPRWMSMTRLALQAAKDRGGM